MRGKASWDFHAGKEVRQEVAIRVKTVSLTLIRSIDSDGTVVHQQITVGNVYHNKHDQI